MLPLNPRWARFTIRLGLDGLDPATANSQVRFDVGVSFTPATCCSDRALLFGFGSRANLRLQVCNCFCKQRMGVLGLLKVQVYKRKLLETRVLLLGRMF